MKIKSFKIKKEIILKLKQYSSIEYSLPYMYIYI